MIKAGQQIDASDIVLGLTAGEALSARDACYISTSNGKVYKCDADDETKIEFVGFAQEAATTNGAVNLVHNGHLGGFSSLTIGAAYYLSGTAGAITETAPSTAIRAGIATSATTIKISHKKQIITRTYSTSGTWTKPENLSHILVKMWGGGGGAGTYSNSCGGGGGAYNEKIYTAGELSATESYVVGTGGARGAAGNPSSFKSQIYAYGGGSGSLTSTSEGGGGGGQWAVGSSGGAGGAPLGGAVGNPGGVSTFGGGGGGNGANGGGKSLYGGGGGGSYGYPGGNSIYGGGGGCGETGGSTQGTSVFGGAGGAAGQPGNVPGGGAGGGDAGTCVGGDGRVIIVEFYY